MQQQTRLKDAPWIEGLTFRGFRGETDYPLMARIIERSDEFDQIKEVSSVEDIQRSYSHLTNCDPYQDMLFAEVNGETIAYCRAYWRQQPDKNRVYWHLGVLLPEWRRKGIGRVMVKWSEQRLREIAADHPHDGERHFQVFGAETQAGKEVLYLSEGYEPIRYEFEMDRPLDDGLPDVPLPADLELRPVLDDHIRPIWDAMSEAFRDHWGYVPPTEESYQEWIEWRCFNPKLWMVAWDGDQVAGMVLNFIDVLENEKYDRMRGWTEFISVRRPWRRRGLAKALIAESFHFLRGLGMEEAALGVDTQNLTGALRLYESLGFEKVMQWTVYRKNME